MAPETEPLVVDEDNSNSVAEVILATVEEAGTPAPLDVTVIPTRIAVSDACVIVGSLLYAPLPTVKEGLKSTALDCAENVMVVKSFPATVVIVMFASVFALIETPVSGANETSAKSPLYTVDGMFVHLWY